MIRIMLVDDSAVIRGLISRSFEDCKDLIIVAKSHNGLIAINDAQRHKPDIIILDVEMPQMDGITALPEILKVSPESIVIMSSTLTSRNSKITLKALQLGAADYLSKPTSKDSDEIKNFYNDLKLKVRTLYDCKNGTKSQNKISANSISVSKNKTNEFKLHKSTVPIKNIKALAIASSTGGPQALVKFFEKMRNNLKFVPVFITQHMPKEFTKAFANQIEACSGITCCEAIDGEIVKSGKIYLAPGDYHMIIESSKEQKIIKLIQSAKVNFCRPAADPMLFSLSKCYQSSLLTIVFTGMGKDGLEGCQEVVNQNGIVLAQDKQSSVVWGMPGEVAKANICEAVLPLEQLPFYTTKLLNRGTNATI